jgi:hypothetical protein
MLVPSPISRKWGRLIDDTLMKSKIIVLMEYFSIRKSD